MLPFAYRYVWQSGTSRGYMEFNHVSVLLEEVINSLLVKPSGCYIDCTVGGGGHSYHIAQQLDPKLGGRLWGIDQDECALLAASERLAPFGDTVHLVRDNFSNLASVASEHGIGQADGILLDLGVSSYQLDTPERGFSYIHNAPLDMRMDDRSALTASVIVNTYPEHEIADIISRFGEERFARKIAARICEIRADAPIETTSQLADICRSVIPARLAATSGNPAKRTFQAIRIAVNAELDVITPALRAAAELLVPGGRLAVITFHSLEDRIVKNEFSELAAGCTCPPDFPVCVCGHKPTLRMITKKPICPGVRELQDNPRSHSAKLRVAEKLPRD